LAQARKLGADEEDRTPSAIVWRHRTARPRGRTRSASTHPDRANIAPDFSAPARAQAGTAETFPRNQLSAPVRRAVKRRSPPCAGLWKQTARPFCFHHAINRARRQDIAFLDQHFVRIDAIALIECA